MTTVQKRSSRDLMRNIVFASLALLGLLGLPQRSFAQQWSTNGDNISNTNTGNVGVGTSVPYHRFEVAGGGTSIGLFPGNTSGYGANAVLSRIVARSNYGAVDSTSAAEIKFLTGSSAWYKGQIAFFTNSFDSTQGGYTVERMRITESGNVGIGTSSPATQLHINSGSGQASILVSGLGLGVINLQDPSAPTDAKMYQWRSEGGVFRMSSINDSWTNFAQQNILVATSSGNVGIGTGAPTEKLEVSGNIKVSGNINAKYQDVAEWVESSQDLPPSTVVILDPKKSNQVIASTQPYDSRVAGVISLRPGLTLGEQREGRVLVATTGRVKVKVDATNGPIQIGDLLVTSDKPGFAMKSMPVEFAGVRMHRPGTLIGKALEPLAQGTGEILVLLSLQ